MKVVIVGCGFAGLKLARKLENRNDIELVLVDKNNYHQFQPLFYQVATASLDASNISFPIRKAFQCEKNFHFRMAELKEVQPAAKKIITNIGVIDYDILVLAMGADTNFFGNTVLQSKALPMKSTSEALVVRHHLIQKFEDALQVLNDEQKLINQLSIVVVGGGPTGVEVSGALAEMRKHILPKDYPEIDFSKMNIYLLEGLPKTLATMSQKSSDDSRLYLQQLGVKVLTGTMVKDYDGEKVLLTSGEVIYSKTVIWAAGIRGNVPHGIDADAVAKGNRIKVDRYNKIIGYDSIYAIGDIATMATPKFPNGHPQLANVAINQGKNLAENILKLTKEPNAILKQFEYNDKGSMATVGRNRAVVDIPKPKLHLKGFTAWFMWMGVHLFLILGVKNKIQIFINWVYKFFTFDQNLRLLFKGLGDTRMQPPEPVKDKKPEVEKAL